MMPEKPMTDESMPNEQEYNEWIANRRAAEPSCGLTDRVMASVMATGEERDVQRKRYVRLADHMNESRPARWAACLAAMLVGCLPFLFVAYFAKLLVL